MKSAKSQNAGKNNDSIDLLRQNIWKELEATKITAYSKLNDKKINELENLMDQAFDNLLEKIIRQS